MRSSLAVAATALTLLVADAAWAGPQTSKANPALTALYEEHVAHQAGLSGLAFATRNPLARVVDERVVVDAVADGDASALRAELTALGMRNTAVFGRVVSGELPLSAVPALDRVATLRFARPSAAARRVGAVTSQGDQAMRANLGRAAFGVTGAGVKVGVLSDSFDCRHGAAANVVAGDLPPVTVLEEVFNCAEGTDEGRAMLQIVHDVAPGASLAFASAFNGEASFAQNIVALKDSGARVIVEDIFYFAEPMFQDGIIAQAVDAVVAQGVAFFSAAGNDARRSYESAFRPGSTFASGAFPGAPYFFGGVAHNFAPSGPADHFQRITISTGRTLAITFQWDSPFFSVSGPPGTLNDLDVYLFNAAGTQVVAGETFDNTVGNTGGDAVETLTFTNFGPTADFNLMIVKFAGTNPGFMKYIQLGGSGITIAEYDTASPTVFGHSAAAGAEAVGAAFFASTPPFGINPPLKESFSSAGPARILFDTAGNRLATPITRVTPRIVAPDGVTTTVTGFASFFGTSAAAPHAAGVAALLLERQPALTPAAVNAALETTALDMGSGGFDFETGFGLIEADAALQFVGPSPSLGLTLNRHTVAAGDLVQVGISIASPGPSMLQDLYLVLLGPPAFSATVGCQAGDALVFVATAFSGVVTRCSGSAPPQTYPPVIANLSIPAAPSTITNPSFFSFPWPIGLPSGTYTVAIATTLPFAFTDRTIGPADVSAIATDTFQTSP